MRVDRRILAIVLWASCLCFASGQGHAEPYRLGPGDELRVSVPDVPQLSASATVSDDGAVALAAAGRVSVQGLTLSEATEAIRKSLSARVVDPSVAVEVARYRPFFVLGDVANPGLYPWFPGATVAQAVAAAGGYRGRSDHLQSAVAGIRAAEALASVRYQLAEAQVQEVRIRAELEGRSTMPTVVLPTMAEADLVPGFVARETEVFDTRAAGFAKQTDLLKREQQIRGDEVAALEERIKAQGRQGENLRKEIAEIQALIGRGLSPTSRLNDLNREESRLLSDTLQTQVLANQARNGRNQAELQLSNIARERRLQTLAELQEVLGRIQRLRFQLRAEGAIVLEAAAAQGRPSEGVRTSLGLQARSEAVTRPVDEAAAIGPGDVLRVERTLGVNPSNPVARMCGLDDPPERCGACRSGEPCSLAASAEHDASASAGGAQRRDRAAP